MKINPVFLIGAIPFILIIIMFIFLPTFPESVQASTDAPTFIRSTGTITIDGCEYVYAQTIYPNFAMTHKGNCVNH